MKKQKGFILVYVLIFMVVGALIITPTLTLTSTTLIATRESLDRMERFYAADGGVEMAIHSLQNGASAPETLVSSLNNCNISVDIETVLDVGALIGTLADEPKGQIVHAQHPHSNDSGLDVTMSLNGHILSITVVNTAPKKSKVIKSVGAWVFGTHTFVKNISNLNGSPKTVDVSSGTSFIWNSGVTLKSNEAITFEFEFAGDAHTAAAVSWIKESSDIWIVSTLGPGNDWMHLDVLKTISVATKPTGKKTTVTSYMMRLGSQVLILTFQIEEINLSISTSGYRP